MRNRAKCKLCSSILESFHKFDYVSCKCGEISISGGSDSFETAAKDYSNFLRISDDGTEIKVKVLGDGSGSEAVSSNSDSGAYVPPPVVGKKERLSQIITQIEELPSEAMDHPLTHYDLLYILRLIKENIS